MSRLTLKQRTTRLAVADRFSVLLSMIDEEAAAIEDDYYTAGKDCSADPRWQRLDAEANECENLVRNLRRSARPIL